MVLGNMAVWYSLLVDQTTWMFGFIKMYISKTKLKNCFISGMLTVCHKPVQVLLASSGLTARHCSASRLVSSIICVKNALVRYNWTQSSGVAWSFIRTLSFSASTNGMFWLKKYSVQLLRPMSRHSCFHRFNHYHDVL